MKKYSQAHLICHLRIHHFHLLRWDTMKSLWLTPTLNKVFLLVTLLNSLQNPGYFSDELSGTDRTAPMPQLLNDISLMVTCFLLKFTLVGTCILHILFWCSTISINLQPLIFNENSRCWFLCDRLFLDDGGCFLLFFLYRFSIF